MSARVAARGVGGRVALAVALLTAAAVAAPSVTWAQGELFEQGNRLYQQEDFEGAIDAYLAVLSAGWESAALHYNLGNAYFKAGQLGRAILEWERALVHEPGNPDALANLGLARSLTADAVEPLPRFWLFDVVTWWVNLLPRRLLRGVVAFAWLALATGVGVRVLARSEGTARWGGRVAITTGAVVLVLGINLFVRELGIGRAEHGVVLADAVPVRSAPADRDDLTLFEIHEGTRVRIDQRAGEWAEIVLDDGKVGWVRSTVFEEI
jgi:tetratricopeptide (TPR) repeat protein